MLPWVIPAITGIASLFGKATEGSAKGRQAADTAAADRYRTAANIWAQQQQNQFDQWRMAQKAPLQRASQSVRGDVLSGVQPYQLSHPRATIPQSGGGYNPSLLSPASRLQGNLLTRDALIKQLTGDLPQMIAPPSTPAVSKPSIWEKLGGIGALAGGTLGILGQEGALPSWGGTLPSRPLPGVLGTGMLQRPNIRK